MNHYVSCLNDIAQKILIGDVALVYLVAIQLLGYRGVGLFEAYDLIAFCLKPKC